MSSLLRRLFLAEQRGLQLQKIVVRGENAHQIFHNGQLVGTLTAVRGENAVDVSFIMVTSSSARTCTCAERASSSPTFSQWQSPG